MEELSAASFAIACLLHLLPFSLRVWALCTGFPLICKKFSGICHLFLEWFPLRLIE